MAKQSGLKQYNPLKCFEGFVSCWQSHKDAGLEMCYLVWERTRLQLLLGAAKGKGTARAEETRKRVRGT